MTASELLKALDDAKGMARAGQDQTDVLVAIFAILQVLLKHEADKAVSRR